MKRSLIVMASLALVLAACGGGDESTETTISSNTAPTPDDAGSDQTPPPETTPAATPPSTSPLEDPHDTAATDDTADDGGTATDTTSGEMAAAGDVTVEVGDSDLGNILVDGEGMTLYVFLADEGGQSTCYDACEGQWPPLGEAAAGAGADESMLGTVERDDGSTQATYNDWPLYYYAGDGAPGETNGQGVGDNWFAIDPSGEVVEGAATQSGAPSGVPDYDY